MIFIYLFLRAAVQRFTLNATNSVGHGLCYRNTWENISEALNEEQPLASG